MKTEFHFYKYLYIKGLFTENKENNRRYTENKEDIVNE